MHAECSESFNDDDDGDAQSDDDDGALGSKGDALLGKLARPRCTHRPQEHSPPTMLPPAKNDTQLSSPMMIMMMMMISFPNSGHNCTIVAKADEYFTNVR